MPLSDANYGKGKRLTREVGGGAKRDEKIYEPKGINESVTDGGVKSRKKEAGNTDWESAENKHPAQCQ